MARQSGHGPPEFSPTRPRIIRENRLRCRSPAHGQPIRACADAIPRDVDRALQVITRVRQQVPNPHVHVENVLRRIFLLAELDEPDGSADKATFPVGASVAFGAVGVAPLHATVNTHKPTARCRM